MAIHKMDVAKDTFYTYWQGHRTAILLDYDEKYKQWDTFVLTCESVPKWKDLPIYLKISFVEYAGKNTILLHLKR